MPGRIAPLSTFRARRNRHQRSVRSNEWSAPAALAADNAPIDRSSIRKSLEPLVTGESGSLVGSFKIGKPRGSCGGCCGSNVKFEGLSADYKRRLWIVIAINAGMFAVDGRWRVGWPQAPAGALDFLSDVPPTGSRSRQSGHPWPCGRARRC